MITCVSGQKINTEILGKILHIGQLIGNTPVIELGNEPFGLFAKLEYRNYSGSIKDRAVNHILYQAVLHGQITDGTVIVESSSGNFAISLALHCKYIGLKFIAVVDPNINKLTLAKIKLLATEVVMVTEMDETGGYLLNRIRKVREILDHAPGTFWTNQYENENNFKAYRKMGDEIDISPNYVFVSVSSCGTVVGLSKYLKARYPHLKVIGVDIEGSMIFSDVISKRYISGIGSSRKPFFELREWVDDHITLNHAEIINGCNKLLNGYGIFAGGSSGACYAGAGKYLEKMGKAQPSIKAMIICPDGGDPYMDNLYDAEWTKKFM